MQDIVRHRLEFRSGINWSFGRGIWSCDVYNCTLHVSEVGSAVTQLYNFESYIRFAVFALFLSDYVCIPLSLLYKSQLSQSSGVD